MSRWVVVLGVLAGCESLPESDEPPDTGGESTTGTTGAITTAITTLTTAGGASMGASTGTSTTNADGDSGEDDTSDFLQMPDLPDEIACSFYDDECPEGFKCMPGYAGFKGPACAPIADDPKAVGEPCVAEDGWGGSLDDCERDTICMVLDHDTNEGVCTSTCNGTPGLGTCDDPAASCDYAIGQLDLCYRRCSPLGSECLEGEGCYPTAFGFTCVPAPTDGVAAGSGCTFASQCEPGLACFNAEKVPPCDPDQDANCCSPFCDLSDPDPPCFDGQTCLAWYPGDPPGRLYDDLGVCTVR